VEVALIFGIPLGTVVAVVVLLAAGAVKPRLAVGMQLLVSLLVSLAFLALLEAAKYRVTAWPFRSDSSVPTILAAVLVLAMIIPILVRSQGRKIAKVAVGIFTVATHLALSFFVGLDVACSNGHCL
jgi:hypothetical protein